MVVVHEDEHTWGATMARRIIFWLLDVLEVLLAFRFFLLLLSANPASPFVQLIYRLTQPFVTPFTGIFPQPAAGGAVVEWATLLAMAVYAVVAWGVIRLIWILQAHEEPAEDTVVDEDVHDPDAPPRGPYV
jgi:uncharacterized protein YggT (Ycf19 family)